MGVMLEVQRRSRVVLTALYVAPDASRALLLLLLLLLQASPRPLCMLC
jgi:hypothetical protein